MTYTHQGLSRAQERALLEQALDVYQGEEEDVYPDDKAHEIIDSWLPISRRAIREAWEDAEYPESDSDSDTASGDIYALMTAGLRAAAWGYLYRFIGEAGGFEEAAAAIEEELGLTV